MCRVAGNVRHIPDRGPQWLALGVGLLLVAAAAPALGEPIPVERPVRVVVAPTSFRAFGSLEDGTLEETHSEAFREGVRRYLANHEEAYRLVGRDEIRGEVTSQPVYQDTRGAGDDWAKLGIENYKKLRTEEAIRQLENAVEKYRSIDYDLVEPERVAEVLMYLALSYLNQGDNAARPLTLIEEMIRLDPQRVLRKGFYPDNIVNFYVSARQGLLRSLQATEPSEERASKLAEMAEAELVVFGSAVPAGDDEFEARLFAYSRPDDQFVESEAIGVETREAEGFRRASNRLIGRMTPCLYRPETDRQVEPIVDSRGDGPLSIRLNFAYGSFLEYPDTIAKPFGNIGLSAGFHVLLTREFGLRAGVDILHSMKDYSGRIIDNLNIFRTYLGPDLGGDVGPLNLGASVALEGTHVSPFVLCQELNVPAQATGCANSSDRQRFDPSFMVGVNVHPRVRLELIESFELVAGGGYTYYFVPFSEPALNNPISGEIGVQYRF